MNELFLPLAWVELMCVGTSSRRTGLIESGREEVRRGVVEFGPKYLRSQQNIEYIYKHSVVYPLVS